MSGIFEFLIFNLPLTLNEDNPVQSELIDLSRQAGSADLVSLAYELYRGTNGEEFGPEEQAVLLFLIYLCYHNGGRAVDLEAEADEKLIDELYSRAVSLSYSIPASLGYGLPKTHENAIELFSRFERLFLDSRVRLFLGDAFQLFQAYLSLHHNLVSLFYHRLFSEVRDLTNGTFHPKEGINVERAAFCRAALLKESHLQEFMKKEDWIWFCPEEVQKMGSWLQSIPVLELEDGYWLFSPELVLATLWDTYSMLSLDLSKKTQKPSEDEEGF